MGDMHAKSGCKVTAPSFRPDRAQRAMKAAIMPPPEIALAIQVQSGAAPGMSIGLVQGDPQKLTSIQALLKHLFSMPTASIMCIAAMTLGVILVLTLSAGRLSGPGRYFRSSLRQQFQALLSPLLRSAALPLIMAATSRQPRIARLPLAEAVLGRVAGIAPQPRTSRTSARPRLPDRHSS